MVAESIGLEGLGVIESKLRDAYISCPSITKLFGRVQCSPYVIIVIIVTTIVIGVLYYRRRIGGQAAMLRARVFCSICGARLAGDEEFCANCGCRLNGG